MIIKIKNKQGRVLEMDVDELLSIDGQPPGQLLDSADDGELLQRVCYLEGQMQTVLQALFHAQADPGCLEDART